jgi:hypothetical protein
MKAKELEQLIFNPFHTSQILHNFFCGVKTINENGVKLELVNIVLPIIYNETFVENTLSTLNNKSTFNSLFSDYEFKIFNTNINQEILNFKSLTKNSLIILLNENKIIIDEFIIIKLSIDYREETDTKLKKIYKAAYNLGRIIAKENYLSLFLKLKITEL